jgi:hypothetical protein
MGTTIWPYAYRAWNYRMPIMVLGSASAGPHISGFVVPTADEFWDNMQADGDDLRVLREDAAVDYSNDAPDTSARTIANFHIECTAASSATTNYLYWLYWGNSAATNAEGTVTTTTPLSYFSGQTMQPSAARTVLCVPDPPGASTPSQRISKKQDEELILWWDLSPAMEEGPAVGGRTSSVHRLSTIDWHATTGTGVYSAESTREATYTTGPCLVTEVSGRLYVGLFLAAGVGTSGTDYVAKLRGSFSRVTSGATAELVFEFRCLVQVRDPFP